MIYIYASLAVLLATLRTTGIMADPSLSPHLTHSLQAFAHVFDGMLLVGGGLAGGGRFVDGRWISGDRKNAMAIGWILAFVELFTFVVTKVGR